VTFQDPYPHVRSPDWTACFVQLNSVVSWLVSRLRRGRPVRTPGRAWATCWRGMCRGGRCRRVWRRSVACRGGRRRRRMPTRRRILPAGGRRRPANTQSARQQQHRRILIGCRPLLVDGVIRTERSVQAFGDPVKGSSVDLRALAEFAGWCGRRKTWRMVPAGTTPERVEIRAVVSSRQSITLAQRAAAGAHSDRGDPPQPRNRRVGRARGHERNREPQTPGCRVRIGHSLRRGCLGPARWSAESPHSFPMCHRGRGDDENPPCRSAARFVP
jgi:hypothetical protein